MAPLKHFLATCGLASALASSYPDESCEADDAQALLQAHVSRSDLSLAEYSAQSETFFPKLASLNDPHTRKSALLEMEKTAIKLASMDKTEATPVVIQVCTDTAELLNTTVLYAIIEEDAADRASLQAAYDSFEQWETQRADAEAALLEAEAVVTQRADALAECRTVETETCVNETICSSETHDYCIDRDRLERELQLIDEEIHTSWCLEGTARTSTEFRTTTVEVFHRYTEKWNELQQATGGCEEVIEHCETTLSTYIEQATQCNAKQSELQMASCEYHHVAAGALAAYQQGFQAALSFYNDIVARVMIGEADRKVEWDVLTRVICLLLTLTNEEDGVTSSAETAARIERCWSDDVDVSHLDIDYLDPPHMLSLPELPPLPCTAEYDDHYELGPPAACEALVELHNTHATSECSCLADEVAEQGIILGHFLLVDPGIDVQVQGDQWHFMEEVPNPHRDEIPAEQAALFSPEDIAALFPPITNLHHGPMSAWYSQDFSELSEQMLTQTQLTPLNDDGTANDQYTGPIARIAWAYGSGATFEGAMNLGQRFASRGGMVFMSESGEVIAVRELAPSSGTLGQPVSTTLSFASALEVTTQDVQSPPSLACGGRPGWSGIQDVPETSEYYAQGARRYCWTMGTEAARHVPQCLAGCFMYFTTYGDVVFPLIEGMHVQNHPTGIN